MESAIPKHLKQQRTRSRSIKEDFQPPYPATVARFTKDIKNVVMAYFGVQFPKEHADVLTPLVLKEMGIKLSKKLGPAHWDIATYEDEESFVNLLFIAYWDQPSNYEKWYIASVSNWLNNPFNDSLIGTFLEELTPSVERFETLYSSVVSDGVDHMSSERSSPMQEHGYWGSMRDRIPLSQTDAMDAVGHPQVTEVGLIKKVLPQQNLCLIRSGQDWTMTCTDQRKMYLEEVEPVLAKGMLFLRDEGESVDCYVNRYMKILDSNGNLMEQSFGMGWWRSLEALEKWSKSHPTHVAIFGAAMKYLNKFSSDAKLTLYHEVSVADKTEQRFEYYNCHSKTGMLKLA